MKKLKLLILFSLIFLSFKAQVITTNRNAVGMEHNLLFNARSRYSVSMNLENFLNLDALFDGNFQPSYSATAPTAGTPLIITIDNLPAQHTQAGAWIGWSTRYWNATSFKVEIYNTYNGSGVTPGWYTLTDHTSYTGVDFNVNAKGFAIKTIKLTFRAASGDNGKIGISEIFFLHPEATTPYNGLNLSGINYNESNGNVGIGISSPKGILHTKSGSFVSNSINNAYDANILIEASNTSRTVGAGAALGFVVPANTDGGNPWQQGRILVTPDNSTTTNASGRMYLQTRYLSSGAWHWNNGIVIRANGDVGIGTDDPKGYKLAVAGKIVAEEVVIKLKSAWPDYVFSPSYKLRPLTEVEHHIQEKGHLPEVPSAAQMQQDGVGVSEMQTILLQKVEELTLYVIELNKQNEALKLQVEELKK